MGEGSPCAKVLFLLECWKCHCGRNLKFKNLLILEASHSSQPINLVLTISLQPLVYESYTPFFKMEIHATVCER